MQKAVGDISLELSARGDEVNPVVPLTEWVDDEADLYMEGVLRVNRHRLGYSRKNGENIISIEVHDGGGKQIVYMGAAVFLGGFVGLAMRVFSFSEAFEWTEMNFADPMTAMFMRALMLMASVLVFSAITFGITNMSRTVDLGRIGVRMVCQSILLMLLVSVLAVGLGILLFPENLPHLALLFEGAEDNLKSTGIPVVDMFVNIVPRNPVDPFRGGNLMQVLFLSIFFGIVLNRMGEKAAIARELIEFLNRFSMNVMSLVARCVPLIVFFSIAKIVFHTDVEVLATLGKIVAGNVIAVPVCWVFFALAAVVYGKLSPGVYVRKLMKFAPYPFAVCSSNAILAQTLRFAENRLGIEKSLASFSLPLGIQFHRAGACFFVALPSIMAARVCGVPLTAEFIIKLIFALTILSAATPSFFGGILVVMDYVFGIVGLPESMIPFFMCVDPLVSMFNVVANVSCNITSVLLTATKENMLDYDLYKKE